MSDSIPQYRPHKHSGVGRGGLTRYWTNLDQYLYNCRMSFRNSHVVFDIYVGYLLEGSR